MARASDDISGNLSMLKLLTTQCKWLCFQMIKCCQAYSELMYGIYPVVYYLHHPFSSHGCYVWTIALLLPLCLYAFVLNMYTSCLFTAVRYTTVSSGRLDPAKITHAHVITWQWSNVCFELSIMFNSFKSSSSRESGTCLWCNSKPVVVLYQPKWMNQVVLLFMDISGPF